MPDARSPAGVIETCREPESDSGIVVDINVRGDHVMASHTAAVLFNVLYSSLAKPSSSMEWTDIELLYPIAHSRIVNQAKTYGFMVVDNEEWDTVVFFPVCVKGGVMTGGVGALFAVIRRKLLAILLEKLPQLVALALRCYYDLDHVDQLLPPKPE